MLPYIAYIYMDPMGMEEKNGDSKWGYHGIFMGYVG
jgi:hypothetical protein